MSNNSLRDLHGDETVFNKFKEQVKPFLEEGNFMHKDHFLKKWLTARQNNVDKAVKMFVQSQMFRQRYECDTLVETYKCPEVIEKYITGGICGFDKEDSPIRVELFGNLDMRGMIYSCTKSELEKAKLFECENIVKLWEMRSRELGRTVDGMTVIFDMENVNRSFLWKPALDMYLHMIRILEDNYPEMVKHMFVINAPSIFPILWRLCRPLVSEDMKKKIHVLRGDYAPTLLKYIDAEELPVCFGGLKVGPDGDPRCSNLIKQGGIVPREYYQHSVEDDDTTEKFVVPPRETYEKEVLVYTDNALLKWEFSTEENDIGFGLDYLDGNVRETLLPVQRVNSQYCSERGTFPCSKKGTYVFVFDNTFSWTKKKRVVLKVSVTETHPLEDDSMEDLDG